MTREIPIVSPVGRGVREPKSPEALGATLSGSGHSAEPEPVSAVSAVPASVPSAWRFPEKMLCAWIVHMPDLPEELSAMIGEASALLGHMRETLEALQPFADGVFNDNGDLTVRTCFDAADVERAFFVFMRAASAMSPGTVETQSDGESDD